MKLLEIKNLISEIIKEEFGDGYTNDYQRAYAHSQSTTPRRNDTEKAKKIAKKGKYVLMVIDNVHCKVTDAVLGESKIIYSIHKTRDEAMKAGEKLMEGGADNIEIIGPEDLKPKQIQTPITKDDDIPFEGVGYVYDKDMKKDPKHIPGERWRVKFESIQLSELKSIINEIVNEMWIGFEEEETKNLKETVVAQSKPTPNNIRELWKLILTLNSGQSVNFYNPKNPNGIAPWIYIKKKQDGDEILYDIDIQPKIDYNDKVDLLRNIIDVGNNEDVTEDEVNVALEAVVKNINILSMYHIETEQSSPVKRPYEGDPDHDMGDYEVNGPDQDNYKFLPEVFDKLIRESIQELKKEKQQ